jgi:hypothetical protein
MMIVNLGLYGQEPPCAVRLESDARETDRRAGTLFGIIAIDVPKERTRKTLGQRFVFNKAAPYLAPTFR